MFAWLYSICYGHPNMPCLVRLVSVFAIALPAMGDSLSLRCTDTIGSMLCHSLHGKQQDMSAFWTSVSGCLTKLTIEVPVERLSACCFRMALLAALKQLQLSCSPAPDPWETSAMPSQQIAISLPQLECLSVSHMACDVELQLDSPKLQSLRLLNMRQVVGLHVSAPRLKKFALRDIRMQPMRSHNKTVGIRDLLPCMSELTSLELLQTSCRYQEGLEELVDLSRLTRLVTTRMYPAFVGCLPDNLRRLIITGQHYDMQDAPTNIASMWHLESLHTIAPDPEGKLCNLNQDVPWGMVSLEQCYWVPNPNSRWLHPSNLEWIHESCDRGMAKTSSLHHRDSLMCMFVYARDESLEQGFGM